MATKLSKNFITEREKQLKEEKEKLTKQIENLKKDDPFADPDHATDNAAVDTDVREQVGHETIQAEIKDLQKRFDDTEIALKKISRGTYGMCEKCGEIIPLARLELIPEARFCVQCENKLRK